jgi:hypothetical protein
MTQSPKKAETQTPESNEEEVVDEAEEVKTVEAEAEDVLALPYAYKELSVAGTAKMLAAKDGLARTGRFLIRTKGKGSTDIILSVVFKGKVSGDDCGWWWVVVGG